MKRFFYLLVLIITVQLSTAQKSLNEYAYVVVPDQFTFLDKPDQYQLSTLSKFLFEKFGMKAFFEKETIPNELYDINCGGLWMRVKKSPSMLKTKTRFELLDCNRRVVFSSKEGVSLIKDFQRAYQQSFRDAFDSFKKMNYVYTPKVEVTPVVQSTVSVPVVIAQPQPPKQVQPKVVAALPKKGKSQTNLYANALGLVIELKGNNGSYIGTVFENSGIEYVKAELVCKLFKTSLKNVFRTQWKNSEGNFTNTIAYFDADGNLKVDFVSPNGVNTTTFFKKN